MCRAVRHQRHLPALQRGALVDPHGPAAIAGRPRAGGALWKAARRHGLVTDDARLVAMPSEPPPCERSAAPCRCRGTAGPRGALCRRGRQLTATARMRTNSTSFLVVIAASARRARDRTSSPNCRRAAYTSLSLLETGRSRVRKEPPAGRACAVRAQWGRELWLLRYRGGSGLTGRLCRCANVPTSPSSARAAGRCSARRGAWPLL